MGCSDCGKGTRYQKITNNLSAAEKGEKVVEFNKSNFNNDRKELISELSKIDYAELEKIKKHREEEEYESYMSSTRLMSDDLKIAQVILYIEIINGEKFSPGGHTPEYCTVLLNKILNMVEFECVNTKFPLLKVQVNEKYKKLFAERIILG